MPNPVSWTISDGVAVITVDNPPVNAVSHAVRKGLISAADALEADDAVQAMVLRCAGRTFIAGADIREFDAPVKEPSLPLICNRIEGLTKPVVAAIHGTALGGGFELAMACHGRVADADARVGLPEVNLGFIPGAGGTQRLPRLIGAEAAIDAIATGRHIPAEEALAMGAIDEISAGDLIETAVAMARRLARSADLPRTGDRKVDPATIPEGLFDSARRRLAKERRGFDAPQKVVDAVEWAVTLPVEDGLAMEWALSSELKASLQSKAQRHLFFAERQAAKVADIPKDIQLRPVEAVAIIGAGTMGAGIALCFLNAGLPVTLVETKQDALDRGIDRIIKSLAQDADKGRLSPAERDRRQSLLSPVLDMGAVKGADLVVEAVFEDMTAKKSIFTDLEGLVGEKTILATNTSTLNINDIASATSLPERVIGTHFFSPANVMRLLEVVRGDRTAKDVIATVMSLGRRIGKTPVLSGVGWGFIGNRMLEDYVRESQMLLLEGASPALVDGVLERWGMAMGPCAVKDLAGQDVSYLARVQNRHLLPDDPRYYRPGDLMYELGRLGQKAGRGFYLYPDGRSRQDDPEVTALIKVEAEGLGVPQRDIGETEILERCLYPLINVGAQLLEDGIAQRAADIDVVWTAGYGFPVYRGGPMFFGDTEGLAKVTEAFARYAESSGNPFGYWTPAPLLAKLAKTETGFAEWDRKRQEG